MLLKKLNNDSKWKINFENQSLRKNPLNHFILLQLIKAYKFIAYLLKTYFVSDRGDHF